MPTQPPSGQPPPDAAPLPSGEWLDLGPIVEEICRRYRLEFPDEERRYGEAGIEWCLHDNRYIAAWAAHDVEKLGVDLLEEIDWLARVLEARAFPLDRLARDLEIAAEVWREQAPTKSAKVSERLRDAAEHVRSRLT
jgi:hypothetical protein